MRQAVNVRHAQTQLARPRAGNSRSSSYSFANALTASACRPGVVVHDDDLEFIGAPRVLESLAEEEVEDADVLRSLYVGTMTLVVMTELAPTATERRAQVDGCWENWTVGVSHRTVPTAE